MPGGKSGAYETGGTPTAPSRMGNPGANPQLDGMFGRAGDAVNAQFRNSSAGMGLSNAGMNQNNSRNMNDLATQFYGGAYNNEANRGLAMREGDLNRQVGMREGDLGRQMSSLLALPGYASSMTQYGLGMGDVGRNYQQDQINANVGQYNQAQQYPLQRFDIMGQALGIGMGAGGTSVSQSNPGTFAGPTSTAGMLGGYGYNYGGN